MYANRLGLYRLLSSESVEDKVKVLFLQYAEFEISILRKQAFSRADMFFCIISLKSSMCPAFIPSQIIYLLSLKRILMSS